MPQLIATNRAGQQQSFDTGTVSDALLVFNAAVGTLCAEDRWLLPRTIPLTFARVPDPSARFGRFPSVIIPETPEHFGAVRQLTIEAFAASTFGHHGEADIIDALRERCEHTLSLVAIEDQSVVGHILFSRAEIREPVSAATDSSQPASSTLQYPIPGMGLAPMSVHPSRQRRGIGAMLIHEGLRRLDQLGNLFTIVAGHPEYYPRFGFRPAREHSISHGFQGMPQDVFFLRTAPNNDVDGLPSGRAYYHSVFGPQWVNAKP